MKIRNEVALSQGNYDHGFSESILKAPSKNQNASTARPNRNKLIGSYCKLINYQTCVRQLNIRIVSEKA